MGGPRPLLVTPGSAVGLSGQTQGKARRIEIFVTEEGFVPKKLPRPWSRNSQMVSDRAQR